jgi:putative tryptophan/tyrosine transport system substrate-binding protein
MTISHARRRFVAALGGAAVMWPLSARAQQPAPGKWRVAMLMPNRRQDVLRQGLRELGYVQGENLVIEARSIERADRIAALAAELVGLKPDVIVATGTQATQAVQQATRSIPIVMTGSSDPVGTHLVASLAHPGGNVTGLSLFSPELSGKRMEMLRNVTGELSSLAVLWNPDDPPAAIALKETQGAAGAMRLQIIAIEARNADDLAPAFRTIAKAGPNALVILNAPLMSIQGARIAELALGLKLPSIYTDISFPQAGGLMSYGPNFDRISKRAAIYVDRILKGENPADLPVEQPTKFDLVINLKTAKALGLDVPPSVLALADEVIE